MQAERFLSVLYEAIRTVSIFNAIDCSCIYQANYNERMDWHEFAYLLDQLRQFGMLKTSYARQCDGLTHYETVLH